MANHTTGAQRYNKKMDAIFERARSEGRGLVGDSHQEGHGVHSKAMKESGKGREKHDARSKALNKLK